jgi:predicted nuclease of predicted toxin-antitoxin system
MRFLVDENLPSNIADLLRVLGHDTMHVSETHLRGASDRVVWRFAADEGRILVTRDLDFPLPDTPKPPGLILLRVPDSFTRGQIGEVMSAFAAEDSIEQSAGRITVVSPGRVRSRPL